MKLLDFEVGLDQPFFLIAGPCVIESEEMAMSTADLLREITDKLGIPLIYKSSFDKANRTSSRIKSSTDARHARYSFSGSAY